MSGTVCKIYTEERDSATVVQVLVLQAETGLWFLPSSMAIMCSSLLGDICV